jgi:hypothetical protein
MAFWRNLFSVMQCASWDVVMYACFPLQRPAEMILECRRRAQSKLNLQLSKQWTAES